MFKITAMDEMQAQRQRHIPKHRCMAACPVIFQKTLPAKREIENVRNNVGMLDGSTLGKFRIYGPDALKALQRVYVSDHVQGKRRTDQIFSYVQ